MVAGYRNLMMIANEILYEHFTEEFSGEGWPFIEWDSIGALLRFEGDSEDGV